MMTGYIKQMLKSFNLPMCKILTVGSNVPKDIDCIYKNYVLRSKNSITNFTGTVDEDDFTIISNTYQVNDFIPNITKNLVVNSLVYDTYTHIYLGQYLRFIRDYYGVNLMSLYNCFTNNQVEMDFEISNDKIFNSSEYNIYEIPIKFNQIYTMAFTSPLCEIMCLTNNDYVANSYFTLTNTSFHHPFTYICENTNPNKEYVLKMYLKVPKGLQTSFVILEGNYKSNIQVTPRGKVNIDYAHTSDFENINSQLLYMNSNKSFPFSDKLFGYLLGNSITPIDEISNNIKRLQLTLIELKYLKQVKYFGIWDEDLTNAINNYIRDNKDLQTKFDILNYIDKDIEKTIKLKETY